MRAIKIGETYEVSELRMGGYSPVGIYKFEGIPLIKKFGPEAWLYRKGSDNCLVVKDSGLLKVIAHFDSKKEIGADIFREKKWHYKKK